MNGHYICPVCGYNGLEFPPRDYSICACCGTEFGYDDRALSHSTLRVEWILKRFPWFDADEPKPVSWNPIGQLIAAGFTDEASAFLVHFAFEQTAPEQPTPKPPAKVTQASEFFRWGALPANA